MKIIVVGAGISGATIARQLAEKNIHVYVIDKRNHIAGNCYDYVNEIGIRVSKYGPHLFHTNSERVWDYLQRFTKWTPWKHRVLGKINGTYFPIPINIDSVNILCGENIKSPEEMKAWLSTNTITTANPPINSEEVALSRVGPDLYEKVFKYYTMKQWDKSPSELEASVMQRIPVKTDWNPYYFSDKYEGIPSNGYTAMVTEMLNHPNITVGLEKEYTHEMRKLYDYVFYTGPIDVYYSSSGYDKLEYRSIRFEEETLNMNEFQPVSQVNYTQPDIPFTRITEYKHILNQDVKGATTIVREYSTAEGEPYYPVPTSKNRENYRKYQELAMKDEENGVFFVGRLATYKYYNMDAAILAALEAADIFLDKYIKSDTV
jgi:UDP-galactopyranose mutase